jgi:predicted RNA-binding protein YlxR (DUF448 family)
MGSSKGHIPVRSCISCGAKRGQKELVRLILDAQGLVVRDDRGKGRGRGAYVCRNNLCLEKLETGNRLKRAFRKEGPLSLHSEFREEMSDGGTEERGAAISR